MATAAKGGEPTTYYSAVPPPPGDPNNHHLHHHIHYPQPQDHQCYVLLPPYPRRRRSSSNFSTSLFFFLSFLLLCIATYLLWPSNPHLDVVRLHLNNVHIRTSPHISLDISMALTIRVRNQDFYSLDYRSLVVSIGYRGRKLGFVTSEGGFIKARSSSYVDAELQLNGIEVLHDAFYLLEDLARGSIPFDTVTTIQGQLGLLLIQLPIEAKVSCEVYVNTDNQTVVRQNCYPQ